MADPLVAFIRPANPGLNKSRNGTRTEIQYIGPAADLQPAQPNPGDIWGDYEGSVTTSDYKPLQRSNAVYEVPYATLTVVCELNFGDTGLPGTEQETTYEIEWVAISRPLFEHPIFTTDEGPPNYTLDDEARQNVAAWKDEKDTEVRGNFGFYQKDKNGNPNGAVQLLSDAEKKLAQFFIRGVETYDDYAPVARKTTTYTGGPPPDSEAGELDTPVGFPNLPTGWEWVKSADRSLRAGNQTRWARTVEWTGAKKVLVDNVQIYI